MGLISKLIGNILLYRIKYPFGFLQFLYKSNPRWYDFSDLEEQCPCCDYITLPESGISYKCPICFWEDEGDGIDQPDAPSELNNSLALRQARKNFNEFGAFDKDAINKVESVEDRKDFECIPREL